MRSSIAMATFTALAAGTVGVGALDSVPAMTGSDTIKDLTIAVVNACGANCKGVSGGSAGSYGITYTTASDSHAALPDVSLAAGDAFTVSIPEGGVITVFEK